jgi:hypothetical protein
LRQEVRRDLLVESKKLKAWKLPLGRERVERAVAAKR